MSGVPTYVALLRAVNLGARNKVAMADLRELFAALGSEDVATYVQSGNVVFKSRDRTAGELAEAAAERLRRDLGLDVAVMVRTAAQLRRVAAGNPFAASETDVATHHVTFLGEAPARARIRALAAKDFAPDRFHVTRGHVYVHCPAGYGRTKLTNAFFEKQLAVPATTRNWKTVTALAELAAG